MTGLSFAEFCNKLYYGADIDFHFSALFYHISSGCDEANHHSITVYEYDTHPDTTPSYYKELCTFSDEYATNNVEAFLNAPIFGGKNLYEIEDIINIIYS